MGELSEKTVVLTGASGGIGSALADCLIGAGIRKIILQYRRSINPLLPILKKYDLNPEQVCFQADLTSEQDVKKMGDAVLTAHGTVWGIINLAGATSNGMSWQLSLMEFDRIVASSLTSTFLVCKQFVPTLRKANGGRIINISSVVAFTGVPAASHYCASKAAVVGFTKSLALELVRKNITVNAVALGYFNYGMIYTLPAPSRESIISKIPAGRFGQINELGGTIGYLLSNDSAYMTGQVIHINGGMYS